jgi:hypothetical protein
MTTSDVLPSMCTMSAHKNEFCLMFSSKSTDIFKNTAYANVWMNFYTFVFEITNDVLKLSKRLGNLRVFGNNV